MSCSCNSNPCACNEDNEPLSSALNNFTTALFGTLTKTCVNNQVVWTLPCDLEAGNPSFPRNSGEGLACYFTRFISTFISAQVSSIGNKGYRSTVLTDQDITLNRAIDVINQDFTGTTTGPVIISLESAGSSNGDEFYLSFTDLNITTGNHIHIKSDATSLLIINMNGQLDGYIKAVQTGTLWKLTLVSVNLT